MKRDWIELDKKYILPTYSRMPVVVKEAEGMVITDINEKKYLDFFSGLAVNVLGHRHPKLVEELKNQSEKFFHISNYFYNIPAVELAEKLVEHTFPGKVFFTNSGAESTEAAIKYIYKYGKANDRNGIVVFKNSFHGRTLGALKLTRMCSVQQDFPMINYPVYELEEEKAEQLEKIFQEFRPAALLFEPITGSGGVHVVSIDFVEKAAQLCKKYKVLLCLDEIQTGIGRTGKLFAYQYSSITPDILLFAKGIGGGLSLGGILVADEISNYFKPGDHGTTFAPNPVSASLGRKTIEILYEEGLLRAVQRKGEYFIQFLNKLADEFPGMIGDIRGVGLMIGVEVLKNHDLIKERFMEKNILVNITNGNVLRLIPPLIIEMDEIDHFINVFRGILTDWKK